MKKTLLALLLGLTCVFATGCSLDALFDSSSASEVASESVESSSSEETSEDSSAHEHVYGAWTKMENVDKHSKACECGHTVEADCVGGTATCTAKAICVDCGDAYGTLVAHDFDNGTWVSAEAAGHKKKCANCDAVNETVVAHAWDNTHKCTDCDYQGTHAYGETWTENKADATHTYTCSCGYEDVRDCNCNLWDGTTVDTDGLTANTDTEAKTVEIDTAAQLAAFRESVNGGNSYEGYTVTLTNTINLNNQEWVRIGIPNNPFSGTFDGAGHVIKDLKITSGKDYVALFGNVSKNTESANGAVLKNFVVYNADLTGKNWTAVVAANVFTGSVENVTVKGDVKVSGGAYVGGIVGNGYVNIRNCDILANEGGYIKASSSYLGGISGFRGEGSYIIENCDIKNVTITGTSVAGGITGIAHYGNTITGCTLTNVAIEYVMATQSNPQLQDPNCVGVIAGTYKAGATVTITNNSFTGTIKTDSALYNDNVVGSGTDNLVLADNTINVTVIPA